MAKMIKMIPLALLTAIVIGCGGSDKAAEANKNLKPVDPNAPRPQAAAGAAGGNANAGKASEGVIK